MKNFRVKLIASVFMFSSLFLFQGCDTSSIANPTNAADYDFRIIIPGDPVFIVSQDNNEITSLIKSTLNKKGFSYKESVDGEASSPFFQAKIASLSVSDSDSGEDSEELIFPKEDFYINYSLSRLSNGKQMLSLEAIHSVDGFDMKIGDSIKEFSSSSLQDVISGLVNEILIMTSEYVFAHMIFE